MYTPLVISEDYIATSVKDAFNITTILAASGDDGVIGFLNNCGYYPQFPASYPYVTAVGGTVGPESGNPEIACTSQISSPFIGITTGGGYLENMKGTPREPFSGPRPYSKTGRGYPDVALLANNCRWYNCFHSSVCRYDKYRWN